jgi:hypothetical protein
MQHGASLDDDMPCRSRCEWSYNSIQHTTVAAPCRWLPLLRLRISALRRLARYCQVEWPSPWWRTCHPLHHRCVSAVRIAVQARPRCPKACTSTRYAVPGLSPAAWPQGEYGLRVTAQDAAGGKELLCLDVQFELVLPSLSV